ncbi:MAG: hypothetical protein GVY16_08340 [Planctomycetes bacterium]|jgi:hypothetical protein|nr:hypothetical protein [Planctomycetota bacterium]
MKSHREKQFVKWAKAHGMGLDDRYPDSAVLTFQPDRDIDCFWETPPEPERRSYFLWLMLELMSDWKSCFVWRHMGSWPSNPDPQRVNDQVAFRILSGLGLPMGTADIIEFDRSETDRLVTLLFSTTVFGWSAGEDLYVVPDHAQYILQTDHHAVIHVSFRDANDTTAFVDGMKEEDFVLPDDLPDPTFKMPEWMGKE